MGCIGVTNLKIAVQALHPAAPTVKHESTNCNPIRFDQGGRAAVVSERPLFWLETVEPVDDE